MLDERSTAGFSETGNDIDHAGGQATVAEIICELESGEWSLLGGLKNAGASCGDRGSKLPCRHEERVVPRNDLSGNADWFFQRQTHRVIRNRIDVADNFGGEATVVFEAGSGVGDVVLGLDDGLAGIAAFEFGECGLVGADFFGGAEEDAAALLRRRTGPRAFFECDFGGGYGAVDVVGTSVGDLGDDFFRGGSENGERLHELT